MTEQESQPVLRELSRGKNTHHALVTAKDSCQSQPKPIEDAIGDTTIFKLAANS
jgi:hypothetical protein